MKPEQRASRALPKADTHPQVTSSREDREEPHGAVILNAVLDRDLLHLLRVLSIPLSLRRAHLIEDLLRSAFLGKPFDPPTVALATFLKKLARRKSSLALRGVSPADASRKSESKFTRYALVLDRDLVHILKAMARAERQTIGSLVNPILEASLAGRRVFSAEDIQRIAAIAEDQGIDLAHLWARAQGEEVDEARERQEEIA